MRSRFLLRLGILVFALSTIHFVPATIMDSREVKIDFTSTNATSQCEWFPSERYSITKEGLGSDGPADGNHLTTGEILTRPVGIGLFWRPAQSARARVELDPAPLQLTTGDGRKYSLPNGRVFVRHSPDLEHWSSWQGMRSIPSTTNRIFEAELGIPKREQSRYKLLRSEYGNRDDVPWSSDEEAAVRWILQKDPQFFSTNLPFIGHVQFLFEGEFVAGHRFKHMRMLVSYSLGGLHQPPPTKELEAQMWTVPWRFKK